MQLLVRFLVSVRVECRRGAPEMGVEPPEVL